MLPIGRVLTGNELLELQKQAVRHIGISLTEACPLGCAHCIVASVPPSKWRSVTLSLEQAHAYAGQLAELHEAGIRHISFTGGEPVLAFGALRLLTAACAEAGISSTAITSCHWAGSSRAAVSMVRALHDVDNWHLSSDRYHSSFVPVGNVLRAANAVLESGRSVVIRMTVPLPTGDEDQQLYQQLREALPDQVPILIQPVSKVGRAENLDVQTVGGQGQAPCLTSGLLVRYDGCVSPCCSSLSGLRTGHPFQYPPATETGLVGSFQAWLADPLLKLIRSVGFAPVLAWLREENADHPALRRLPGHPCQICVDLWKEPEAVEVVRRRCADPLVQQKIAEVYEAVFGPPTNKAESECCPTEASIP